MELLREAMIIAAASLLLVALLPVRRLLAELPEGSCRRGWYWLSALLVTMIGSYLVYALSQSGPLQIAHELVIPLLLLCGSWFILMVSQLSAAGISTLNRLVLLERECVTDPLTGIYNRRYLDVQLGVEQKRAQRNKHPLSMMLLDIDHFKNVNDQHGHQVGDQVLSMVAQTIMHYSRSNDIVARFGGEEIAIIVPNANLQQTQKQAERLRQAIAQSAMPVTGLAVEQVNVTVSIGVAELDNCDLSEPQAMLGRADSALYQAKSAGRNQVVGQALLPRKEPVLVDPLLPQTEPVSRVIQIDDWRMLRSAR